MLVGGFATKPREDGGECRNPEEIEMQSEKEMLVFGLKWKRRGVVEMGFANEAAMIDERSKSYRLVKSFSALFTN